MILAPAVSQYHTSSAVVRCGSNDCAIEHICRSLHYVDILIIVPHKCIKMVQIALILLSYCYYCHSKLIPDFHNNYNESFQISIKK